jgi:metallo-beta-lactamase family protein
MAIDVTKLYVKHAEDHDLETDALEAQGIKPFSPPNLHMARTVEESKAINDAHYPLVVISASGMATGGRILHHLARCLPDHRNTILFVGFQAAGTRGRTILSGAESVKIFGQEVRIRARVETMEHLSAHADYGEILGWLQRFRTPPQKTFLVHGEPHATESLQEKITQQLRWKTSIPSYLERVAL